MKYIVLISLTLAINANDFKRIFDGDYQSAASFIEEYSQVFEDYADLLSTDNKLVTAISFPEAIRYSMIKDYLEIGAMELIYVNTGHIDFSVGSFQMKPSFIGKLEYMADSLNLNYLVPENLNFEYNTLSPVASRQERLNRLQNTENQIFYLNLFCKVLEKRFPESKTWNDEYKTRFYSTAYNYNFTASKEKIVEYMNKSYFPWGTFNDKVKYNYGDIAWYYFQNDL